MTSIYRTYKKTHVPYFGDGCGRESYILYNGGGYFPNKNMLSNPEGSRRTGTNLDTKITYKYKSPFYNKAPNFHYFGNGNGRETYILKNGGGLYYDEKPLNAFKLLDFLRSQEKDKIMNNEKIIVSKSAAKYNKILKLKEKDIINRLYEKEKAKFIRPRPIETEANVRYNTIDHCESECLPKLNMSRNDTYQNNTLGLNIDQTKSSENLDENLIVKPKINIKKSGIFMRRHLKDIPKEEFRNSMEKINLFNVKNRKLRENRCSFQPYLHLKNYSSNCLK